MGAISFEFNISQDIFLKISLALQEELDLLEQVIWNSADYKLKFQKGKDSQFC